MVKTDKNGSGKGKDKMAASSISPVSKAKAAKANSYGFERRPARLEPGPDFRPQKHRLGVTAFDQQNIHRRKGTNSVTTAALQTGEMVIDMHNARDSPVDCPYTDLLRRGHQQDVMELRTSTGLDLCFNKRTPDDRNTHIVQHGVYDSGKSWTRNWPMFIKNFNDVEQNTLANRQIAGRHAASFFERYSMDKDVSGYSYVLLCQHIGDSTPIDNDLKAGDLFTTDDTIEIIKHVCSDRTNEEIADNEALLVGYFGEEGLPYARSMLNPKKHQLPRDTNRPSSPTMSSFAAAFNPSPVKDL